MFTKPVRQMLVATAILFALAYWNINSKPGQDVHVPNLGAIANGMAPQN